MRVEAPALSFSRDRVQTGAASRRSRSRSLTGRLFGVRTCMSMPGSCSGSKRMAPMAIVAVQGRAEDLHIGQQQVDGDWRIVRIELPLSTPETCTSAES